MTNTMPSIKSLTLGDRSTGKTCLLIRYIANEFPGVLVPTVLDNYTTTLSLPDGSAVNLGLWDTAGGEDRLRPLSYPQASVFVLCYSIASPPSFCNIRDYWIPEISQHRAPQTPVILVGTKVDLRRDKETAERLAEQGFQMITREEGFRGSGIPHDHGPFH
eukprot:TRINITY_DN16852_c0_g1_i1.p1 TRINITY_DN16852_c0_g1~~TRINITY_DN16852_c0_g1_i1.p1  ORF type:complete len:161 (-),score=30.08 TRINITY_DN16852_c0_g1_i1:30-512(-)